MRGVLQGHDLLGAAQAQEHALGRPFALPERATFAQTADAAPAKGAAIEAGVRRLDASVGGIGGCPFAPGAAGNLATEDLGRRLNGMQANKEGWLAYALDSEQAENGIQA